MCSSMWQSECHPYSVYVCKCMFFLPVSSLPFVVIFELQQADLISSENCKKLTNISRVVGHQRKASPDTMIKTAAVLRKHGHQKMSKLLLGSQACICISCIMLNNGPFSYVHVCDIFCSWERAVAKWSSSAYPASLIYSQTVPVSVVPHPIIYRHTNCRIWFTLFLQI